MPTYIENVSADKFGALCDELKSYSSVAPEYFDRFEVKRGLRNRDGSCLGSKSSIGNIQIREGPILPGKGVGKKLPQIGHYSVVGIVDKIDENNRFSFNNVRLSFILELAEIISLSLLLST